MSPLLPETTGTVQKKTSSFAQASQPPEIIPPFQQLESVAIDIIGPQPKSRRGSIHCRDRKPAYETGPDGDSEAHSLGRCCLSSFGTLGSQVRTAHSPMTLLSNNEEQFFCKFFKVYVNCSELLVCSTLHTAHRPVRRTINTTRP